MAIELDRDQITAILPHRDPFLFVDAVTEIEPGERIAGELRVDARIPFLTTRDGDTYLAPTILTEAMAQTGAILVLYPAENRGRTIYFRSIEETEFTGLVALGQTVRIHAEVKRLRTKFGRLSVTARVDDSVVASGVMSFALG